MPSERFKDAVSRTKTINKIERIYIVLILVLFVFISLVSFGVDKITESSVRIQNAYTLNIDVKEISNNAYAAQTAARGFALYQDNDFIKEYRNSKNKFGNGLLNALTAEDLSENNKNKLLRIKDIFNKWTDVLDDSLINIRGLNKEKTVAYLEKKLPITTPLIEEIQKLSAEISEDQEKQAQIFIKKNVIQKNVINIFAFLMTFLILWTSLSQAKKLTQASKDLTDRNEMLSQEIDAREKLEDGLHRNLKIYNALLDTSIDAIIITDGNDNILEVSKSVGKIFGHHPRDLVGKKVSETFIPIDKREQYLEMMRVYEETGNSTMFDKKFSAMNIKSDNTLIPTEFYVTRLKGLNEVIYVGYIRDMSGQEQTAPMYME